VVFVRGIHLWEADHEFGVDVAEFEILNVPHKKSMWS
jgi:hypothetical protein